MEKKYSYGFKLNVVQEYLQGTSGANLLAQKYQALEPSLIRKWVNQYQEYGKEIISYTELKSKIEKYIHDYNTKRVKEKMSGLSPIAFRKQDTLLVA